MGKRVDAGLDKRFKFAEPAWKYPYYVRATADGEEYYAKAFKTLKAAKKAAAFLRRMRAYKTAPRKQDRVRVIRRRR